MKISLIVTIFNEEKSILDFLKSLESQSKKPDEIVIVDGGSNDHTQELVKNYLKSKKKNKIRFFVKKGNRSVGRNEAISKSKNKIIAITDAGSILHKDWLRNITSPFVKKNIDVVAGYYKGLSRNIFQKSLIPYVLVMPDKVDKNNFLPATRSMAIKKSVWEEVGKFNENLSHNEDYEFAKRLEKKRYKIYFQKNAVVSWVAVDTLKKAFRMFYRFALGDIESNIIRPKVVLIFLRYFYFLYFIFLFVLYKNIASIVLISISIFFYICWSIKKNYRYVNNIKGLFYLPLIQITSDISVISGSLLGFIKIIKRQKKKNLIRKNFSLIIFIVIYTVIIFSSFSWGAPNQNRIYPYHMDEWHQFQSVVNTYRDGTPNKEGSANGTMFQFTATGFYLTPFIASQYISPSVRLEDLSLKERIFNILRFNTYIFGVLSIVVMYLLLKLIKLNILFPILFFITSPIWILLSGYYKYDIALLFWLILSLFFGYKYLRNPNAINYLLVGLFSGIAIAVKISAAPLIPIYFSLYFIGGDKKRTNYKYFLAGILNLIFVIIIFGIPDTLFNKGNIYYYLYDNVINVPQVLSSNLSIGVNQYLYLFTSQYGAIFGYGLILAFLISVTLIISNVMKFKKISKDYIFLFVSFFLFLFSLLPLGLAGTGNRSLVLLPFFILFIAFGYKYTNTYNWIKLLRVLFIIFIIFQIFILSSWLNIKYSLSSQEKAASWIDENISEGEEIGIENIPIYQMLPDNVVSDYYLSSSLNKDSKYRYMLVDYKTVNLPKVIIITNDVIDSTVYKTSQKEKLINRLVAERYERKVIGDINFKQFNTFASEKDYFFSALVASPVSVSIYAK